MLKPTIDQYLIADCLYIIDEFNIIYKDYDFPKLKKEADEKYNEMDIAVKIGYPFKQTAHYTVGESNRKKKAEKINHDIYIEQLDFKIEVKFLKNWVSSAKTRAVSKNWEPFQKDFDWLMDEIENGNRNKTAFVIGWFNCVDSFSQLIQVGTGRGAYPLADAKKISYFPFLRKGESPIKAKELQYNYEKAYRVLPMDLVSSREIEYNCMFLGSPRDCFHFAIYY